MISAHFFNLTEGEAQQVMNSLDGLLRSVKTGNIHIQLGPQRLYHMEESAESYEAAAAVFEMRQKGAPRP